MIIPCDYDSIFKDRLLLLTGVGRSGTTILGKLLGSMEPAYLVFEPALFKYISPMSQGFLGTLFEDYFLPIIQGRGNWNSRDYSSIHNQMSFADIMYRWGELLRRSDAMLYIERERPLFIVKSLEYQGYFWELQKAVPTVRYLEIIRNGFDVVQSAVERQWFTDEWCNHQMIQRASSDPKCNIPDYVLYSGSVVCHEQRVMDWPNWTPWTRAACAWRCLVNEKLPSDHCNNQLVYYEDLIKSPITFTNVMAELYGLKQTQLTEKFISEIKNHNKTERKKFDINLIEQPERDRFVEQNQKLGYDTP